MKFTLNISLFILSLLFSTEMLAQTGVAIINVSGNKVLAGEGIPFELSFVVKEVELDNEAVELLRTNLNAQPNKYTVQLFKDDVKPELLVICEFKMETFEALNLSFHELLFLLKPSVVLFNDAEYTDYNTVIIE